MVRWEYLIFRVSAHKTVVHRGLNPAEVVNAAIPDLLAEYGSEGWELVGVLRIEAAPELNIPSFVQYTLKRPLPIKISISNRPPTQGVSNGN